jgi:hypothetical protein
VYKLLIRFGYFFLPEMLRLPLKEQDFSTGRRRTAPA